MVESSPFVCQTAAVRRGARTPVMRHRNNQTCTLAELKNTRCYIVIVDEIFCEDHKLMTLFLF